MKFTDYNSVTNVNDADSVLINQNGAVKQASKSALLKDLQTQFNDEIANQTVANPSNAETVAARTSTITGEHFDTIGKRFDDHDSQLAQITTQKADKSEVTNVMTPKGTLAYASLPMTGNTVGWYWYCPDGDGTRGAGNYVWNGTSWYFGGAGDDGYNILKETLANESEYLNNSANEINKTSLGSITLSNIGGSSTGIWLAGATRKSLTKGLYIAVARISMANVSGLSGDILLTPFLYGGSYLYMGDFNSTNVYLHHISGNDDFIAQGYFRISSETTWLFGVNVQNVKGTSFKLNMQNLTLFYLGDVDYSNDSQIPYIELYTKYGFREQYLVRANYTNFYKQSLNNELSLPVNTELEVNINNTILGMNNGGSIRVPASEKKLSTAIRINKPNIGIFGDIRGYNNDPNGVFEINKGSRLVLDKNSINGIELSAGYSPTDNLNGTVIKEVGIQGTVKDSNTQGLMDFSNITKNNGIYCSNGRIDQGLFDRISCSGLASAVCVSPTTNIDACTFNWINGDGCDVGMFIKPQQSFHFTIKDCVLADTPAHGLILDGSMGSMSRLTVDNVRIVRNCGGITETQESAYPACAMYVNAVHQSIFTKLFITEAGKWNDYFTSGDYSVTVHTHEAIGLFLNGSYNHIADAFIDAPYGNMADIQGTYNLFSGVQVSGKKAFKITGNSNMVNGMKAEIYGDGADNYSIQIDGDGNQLLNLFITKPIVINGTSNRVVNAYKLYDASTVVVINGNYNVITGIPRSKVIDNGIGNTIN